MATNDFRAQQSANKGKTYFLLASMGLLTGLVAYAALTYFGAGTSTFMVPLAVGISLIGVWGSFYGSDKLVITMTGAKVIQREDNPELFNVIEEVVIASGLPMPISRIAAFPSPACGPSRRCLRAAHRVRNRPSPRWWWRRPCRIWPASRSICRAVRRFG